MRPIYDFQRAEPPVLTEARLRETLEKRRARREAGLVILAAILCQLCLLVLARALYAAQPMLALVCMGYVCLSISGAGVLALVYTRGRRFPVP